MATSGEVAGKGGTLSLAVAEPLRGKADEAGEMGLVGGGVVFCAEARETNLGGGETAGGEIDGCVLADVETVLNDADEALGEALLLLQRGLTLHVAIEGEVGDGGVLSYAFANVLER